MAKFIAQIDVGVRWLSSTRAPAEAASPAMVSSSGSPAATREPKASTRMAIVTGQEIISECIIESWLAVLKSLHMTEAPVAARVTPSPDRAASGFFRSSAARTMSLVSAAAPARRTAVFPSRLMVAPCWGARTSEIRGSAFSRSVAFAIVFCTAGSETCRLAVTTTCSAEDALPEKCRWASSRTCTDGEPLACQPAPASAEVTWGANAPRPATRASHSTSTTRRRVVAQTPNRPSSPGGAWGAEASFCASAGWAVVMLISCSILMGVLMNANCVIRMGVYECVRCVIGVRCGTPGAPRLCSTARGAPGGRSGQAEEQLLQFRFGQRGALTVGGGEAFAHAIRDDLEAGPVQCP